MLLDTKEQLFACLDSAIMMSDGKMHGSKFPGLIEWLIYKALLPVFLILDNQSVDKLSLCILPGYSLHLSSDETAKHGQKNIILAK